MIDNRIKELANRIKEETANKRLNWVASAYSNSFRLSLGKGMVVLDNNKNNPMLPIFAMTIYNEKNSPIDQLTADSSTDENYELLKQIYDLAENDYMKKDETYQSMFDALDLPF